MASKVEIIVAIAVAATTATRQATSTIPIIMLNAGNPIGAGLMHRAEVIDFAARAKLSAIYDNGDMARSGGLIAYSPDYLEHYALAAAYVDKIEGGQTCRPTCPAADKVQAHHQS